MAAQILDGRATAARLTESVAADALVFAQNAGRAATLAALIVGDDSASHAYVRRIVNGFRKRNLDARAVALPADAGNSALLEAIDALNADDSVDGVILQLPLPAGYDTAQAVARLDPSKDVDGVTPVQAGRLLLGQDCLAPNTPAGGLALLAEHGIALQGAEAVIVGRSAIVGKPMAMMLLAAHATVTICHTRTKDLGAVVRRADIVAVAAGRSGLVDGSMIKPGAVVLDFGTNYTEGGVAGDVDYASAAEVAGWITPVPGGTGPMTNVLLMQNTLKAARQRGA